MTCPQPRAADWDKVQQPVSGARRPVGSARWGALAQWAPRRTGRSAKLRRGYSEQRRGRGDAARRGGSPSRELGQRKGRLRGVRSASPMDVRRGPLCVHSTQNQCPEYDASGQTQPLTSWRLRFSSGTGLTFVLQTII